MNVNMNKRPVFYMVPVGLYMILMGSYMILIGSYMILIRFYFDFECAPLHD